MILKAKVIIVAAAALVGTPLVAWAASNFLGNPLSPQIIACVNGPSNVRNDQPLPVVGDRAVSVTWDAMSACEVQGFNVIVIDSHGTPGKVVATAKSDATGAYVSGLNLCTFYRFGVQAKLPSEVSTISFPANPAFVSGPPDRVPPLITVIVTGTTTSGPADSFSPPTTNFCTSPDGVMPSRNTTPSLKHLADTWLNVTSGSSDPSTRTSGVGNNLIDSLAATGGYVLPYSYRGIVMTGTAQNPMVTIGYFDSLDVSAANPIADCEDPTCRGLGEPALLQASLASIHRTFPKTPIIVIGHSLGGLIAEQWWLQHSAKDPEGVIQVFSLDSPLNGVATSGACLSGLCVLAVGFDPSRAYSGLWAHQSDPAGSGPYANNQTALALDARNHLFTAVGNIGDPLYDFGDYPRLPFNGVRNIGLVSQVLWTEPSCADSGWDLTSRDCTAVGQAIINPCGHNMDDGGSPIFDLPGSLWIHSNVKNCPEVTSTALAWYHQYLTEHPTPPTQAPSQPATVVKKFEPWVAVGQTGRAEPALGLVVTNGGTAICDSGSNDDPGSAVAVRCSPPGNGTPCFINDTGGGDPGSHVLCSADPTSKQVTEVVPAGQNGIPVSALNPGDPAKPAWFLILADGRNCHFLGYGTNTDVLSYDCGSNIGATVPDRSRQTWTVREGEFRLNPTPSSTLVSVDTAYR